MCGPDIGVVVLCHVIVYIFALSFTHAYNFVINKFIKDFKACYVYMLYFILCYFIYYVMSYHMITSVKKEPQLSTRELAISHAELSCRSLQSLNHSQSILLVRGGRSLH